MNILICEDNPIIAMDLGWMLEDMGHHICGTADTSMKGMKQCVLTKPDLVMVDLNLADGRTGLGLVDALAQIYVPSVIVSGETHTLPETTCASAVVSKPFNEDLLAKALADVDADLQRRLLEDQLRRTGEVNGTGSGLRLPRWPWRN